MSSKLADALYRYVPAIDSLRTYNVASFRRDVLAGLTVAAVAVQLPGQSTQGCRYPEGAEHRDGQGLCL